MTAPPDFSLAEIDAAVAQAREARSRATAALLLAIPALFARAAAFRIAGHPAEHSVRA